MKKNKKNRKKNYPEDNSTEIRHTENSEKTCPADENDMPYIQVICFFSVLAGFFLLSFMLKYIFPNIPEYVFEKLLMLVFGAFCAYTLWEISPEIKENIRKHFKKNKAGTHSDGQNE